MSPYPDAWTAVRGKPWRFLFSVWPWRSLAYLATTVPVGLATLAVLFLVLGVGLLTLVVVVGLLVLAGVPRVATVVAEVERRRLGLVLPHAIQPRSSTLRERLRAGRILPVAWPEVGYAVLLATILWVLDGVVLSFVITTPGVFLLAPWLVEIDQVAMFGWQIEGTREAWLVAVGIGLPALVVSAYAITALAAAQAALTRLLLDPQPARLAAAVAELRRSRVGLVDAFESERRRIERDLHDGVQQRLVALTMTLGRAELDVPEGPALDLVREAHQQAEGALEELRSTVRGIHPRVLTDHGLAAAVHEIADRSPVPVHTEIALSTRLPAPVETAAYFVVSEAITNVVRHSSARSAQVHAWINGGRLVLTVVDDGVGGAEVGNGTGLAGLALRLEALDGRLQVSSPVGGPTEVRMECPVDAG
ncbi:sensor histidine kinase [Nocardioides bizhenqiangii]|uniref:histidine kinase n=1 Tax=Nocardioides bizhenqiangii TaxID=3095076 RepID=A0ABZ0ZNJ5_9ACTN|nr:MULTISPECIES: sensor domain-containing protein [unclassified Nocardioides]MDZ5620994.1 sensor domain-containing protein [Nocardioides sp. HM23]WQQ25351.1 sensor domain-containing protein [Nocardioides sp. HM61]